LPTGIRLAPDVLAFDLVYRPRPTAFTSAAKKAGCSIVIDGWPMLIGQADAAFRLWTGRSFPEKIRRELLTMKALP
jgi:shikimate dehydrogenase